jgi:hypothetical protein
VSVEKLVFVEVRTTNLATIIPRVPVDDGRKLQGINRISSCGEWNYTIGVSTADKISKLRRVSILYYRIGFNLYAPSV